MSRSIALGVLVLSISLLILISNCLAQPFVTEDFTTETAKDAGLTTADWNTADGELKLFPFVPTLVGSYNTPGDATKVALAGDLAFVADYENGLVVIDISDPTSPAFAGAYNTSGYSNDVAVAGDLAFVADFSSLQVIDITDPANPTLVGSYVTTGVAFGVAVAGDLVFVADFTSGLQVIDITDPANPALVGSYGTTGTAMDVAVAGDLAFVADYDSGLQVIDISDPTSPALVGTYDTLDVARGVEVAGDLVFVADYGSGLQVIDITDPANPALVGSYDTPSNAYDVAVSGDRAFVADGSSGLQIIDISDPANPTLDATYGAANLASGVAVDGELAFVVDLGGGLQVIDSADPTPPALVGESTPAIVADGIVIAGDLAFVAAWGAGLQIYDITDPTSPALVGIYGPVPFADVDVAIAGDLALLTHFDSLELIDISDPANPILVGTYVAPSNVYGVAVAGNLAFVVGLDFGLHVIDISDPSSPTLTDDYDTPHHGFGIAVDGNLAFVADHGSGLQVLDIADPTNLTLVGTYQPLGFVDAVTVAGDLAFITGSQGFLHVIDIADPANPTLVGACDTSGSSTSVTISGNLAFVTNELGIAFDVIDISNPASPTLAGTHDLGGGDAYCVAVAGDLAFVGMDGAGLKVLQVFQHEVFASDNAGRSLTLNTATDPILRARLSSTQSFDVSWELSADGGANFQASAPGDWTEFATPGTDILWRSTHTWAPLLGNPTVSEVTVEWLNEFAQIEAIADVGNDQGRQVSLEWSRSGHDFIGDASQIAEYAVYRKIDAGLLHRTAARDFSEYSPAVQEHAQLQAAAGWHFLMTVPVRVEDRYAVVVPTLADSTIVDGDYLTTFMVSALTATPGVFFDSYPDSGRSIDNLEPLAPEGITAAYQADSVTLDWADSPESDLLYYRVYRDVAPSPATRAARSATLVAEVTESFWTDVISNPWGYSYKVSAVDQSGNEGVVGEVVTATGTPDVSSTRHFALHEAVPNPFNPSTTISYSIPAAGKVQLTIYNVAGRQVRTLVDGVRDAGLHQVQWNGLDQAGSRAASGVYLYQLRSGTFVETRRMVLLK